MVREVGLALDQRCGIQEGAELVVAVSGGADSLALLAILEVLARKRHRQHELSVVHIHHHLRKESDEEAAAVKELADKLGRRFVCKNVHPDKVQGNLSAAARELRYQALAEVAEAVTADAIVTGHHGTDQLETVLFHLIRGAGLDGLAAMNWRTNMLGHAVVRPMLGFSHANCVAMCRSIGWEWFEDHSNKNREKVRNRIRAEVLPVLREIAPDIESRIWRTTTLLGDISDLIGELADRLFNEANQKEGAFVFDRVKLREADAVVLGYGMRMMVNRLGGNMDRVSYTVVEKVVGAIQDDIGGERRFELGSGISVRIEREQVLIEKEPIVD